MGKHKVSADSLRAAGYIYKMDKLTAAEKKEYLHGRKVKEEDGSVTTYESRDFDYFYKKLDKGVECQIFHAGKKFYYKGGQVRNIKLLPRIEADAEQTAIYAELQKQVKDTKPPVYMPPARRGPLQGTADIPGYITCVGGPLDKQQHKYNNILPFFMWQFDEGGKTLAARYRRDPEDKNKYNFLNIIS